MKDLLSKDNKIHRPLTYIYIIYITLYTYIVRYIYTYI